MRTIFKFFRRLLLILLAFVLVFVIAVAAFLNFAPAIGADPSGEDLERISTSTQWDDGIFVNIIPTSTASMSDVWAMLEEMVNSVNTSPEDSLEVLFGANKQDVDSLTYVTWYGHSAFLFEFSGKRILIDPMLGDYAAPLSFGSKRYPYKKAIPIEEIKNIDAVIISHDHYDHLDYPTIKKIKDEVGHWYTALGVGSHLKRWEIEPEKITEMDWWEETELDGVRLVSCPARHFSGRGLFNQSTTLWASWIIETPNQKLYFSGDGGYGSHFKEIGEKYGPFDFAMMECGQYNEMWSEIHMMPEESVIAGQELNAALLMPIHWGAFALAMHEWTDPIERFKNEALRLKVDMVHPMIGERFALETDRPVKEWWK